MLRIKKYLKCISAALFVAAFCLILTSSTAFAATSHELYLGGFPAGFILETQSVEVVGISEVMSDEGARCPAREYGIAAGDVIEKVNGIEVTSAEQLNNLINEDFKSFELTVLRQGQSRNITVNPVRESATGTNKLGLLVRDSLNGIGTVTYIDRTQGKYGSLGHPVADQTGALTKIRGGRLFGCSIYNVKKGQRGNPGELKGIFSNAQNIGTVCLNATSGIYGEVNDEIDYSTLTKIKAGSVSQAKIGKASIFTTIDGNSPEEYDISIIKVDAANKDYRNFVIRIDDGELLEKTGGIVQGMSGSPIVQDGKLIGAVTHVFINDPTRGYGIAIENMLEAF